MALSKIAFTGEPQSRLDSSRCDNRTSRPLVSDPIATIALETVQASAALLHITRYHAYGIVPGGKSNKPGAAAIPIACNRQGTVLRLGQLITPERSGAALA